MRLSALMRYRRKPNSKLELHLITLCLPSCAYDESQQNAWLGPFAQFPSAWQSPLQSDHVLPLPEFSSQVLTSYTLLPRLPSEAAACSAKPMGNPETLVLAGLVWDCRGRVASQKQGDEGDSAYHVVNWSHKKAQNWARLVQFEHSSVLHQSIDGQVQLLKRNPFPKPIENVALNSKRLYKEVQSLVP